MEQDLRALEVQTKWSLPDVNAFQPKLRLIQGKKNPTKYSSNDINMLVTGYRTLFVGMMTKDF